MPKLAKNCYYGKDGEQKINSYLLNISKEVASKSGLIDKQLEVKAEQGKIIIEEKKERQ